MAQAEEFFDIYDDHLNPIGTASRKEVHSQGLWHRTFQCWIVNEQDGNRTLLFQKRHPQKDTFPGLLDISCAGHLLAGEKIENGNRELEEELGVSVDFELLEPCGVLLDEKRLADGLIDREICHIFVYRSNQPLDSYKLQSDEVTGLYRVSIEDVRRLAKQETGGDKIRAAGVETNIAGILEPVERLFGDDEFVPRASSYYEMMLKVVEK
ncbi:NUDIX domain-containing protein [Paenibacillus sp. LMG 31456]|uniref:NUDIX domain-containing protein n=1 Tax=Paenibacillus foliorum TaxID=2654974 RepID=A0A972GMA8_9BACL|nr:NUDIX domain-containing protein [Paenibacillus foliorum]NOU93327.1 NUDIX domain-containing protein [Paenibacillus foliorum]